MDVASRRLCRIVRSLISLFDRRRQLVPFVAPGIRNSKTVFDSGFQILDSGRFVSGIWIPDSYRKRDSGFLELYSGFQSPGFRIPEANISRINIPETAFPFKEVTFVLRSCAYITSLPKTVDHSADFQVGRIFIARRIVC